LVEVTFSGIAAVPAGAKVKILVDNPDKPTKAIEIKDIDHKITYTSAELGKALAAPNYVKAKVESVVVYGAENRTVLVVSIV